MDRGIHLKLPPMKCYHVREMKKAHCKRLSSLGSTQPGKAISELEGERETPGRGEGGIKKDLWDSIKGPDTI